jgi:hypothetical protein
MWPSARGALCYAWKLVWFEDGGGEHGSPAIALLDLHFSSSNVSCWPKGEVTECDGGRDRKPEQIQKAPQNQRTEVLISGIAQQMQSSNDQNTQQLGAELQNAKSQLVKACQQS